MATDIWKGPGGTVGKPTSGDFFDAANWFSGTLPGKSTDAVFVGGDYTVTMTDAGAEVHSVNIGAGVTIALSGNTAALTTDADSVNAGTVSLHGAYLGALGNFVNAGAIYGDVVGNTVATISGSGRITNDGVISTMPGSTLGYMAFLCTVVNDAAGLITTLAGPGQVILTASNTNNGVIEAIGGGIVTTSQSAFGNLAHGSFTNVIGSLLSGGTWAAHANSAIWLAGTTISSLVNGATVTLDGEGSAFRVDDGSGDPFYLEQTLNVVDSSSTLEVLGGRGWSTTETLDVAGALRLGGGTFAPGSLRIAKDGTMSGFGTVEAQAIVDGKLVVQGGRTLDFTTFTDFNGKITGGGTLALSGGYDTFTTSKVGVKHLLFDGADVQFDQNLRYAGELTATAGTIQLKDSKLTLAGEATIGSTTIQGGPGGVLSVTGDLRAHGGRSDLDVRTIQLDGGMSVDHGTLAINGAVTGGGDITIGAQGVLVFESASRLGAGVLVSMDGPNAMLEFDNLASNGAHVALFDGRDRIDFGAVGSVNAKATWRADDDGEGGTLKVSNGPQTATIHLEENHSRKDFVLSDDGHGGTVVTLAKPAGAGLVDASAFGADAHGAGGHLFLAVAELHGGVLA